MKTGYSSHEEHQAAKDQEFVRIMIERQNNADYEEHLRRRTAKIYVNWEEFEHLREYDTDYDQS